MHFRLISVGNNGRNQSYGCLLNLMTPSAASGDTTKTAQKAS